MTLLTHCTVPRPITHPPKRHPYTHTHTHGHSRQLMARKPNGQGPKLFISTTLSSPSNMTMLDSKVCFHGNFSFFKSSGSIKHKVKCTVDIEEQVEKLLSFCVSWATKRKDCRNYQSQSEMRVPSMRFQQKNVKRVLKKKLIFISAAGCDVHKFLKFRSCWWKQITGSLTVFVWHCSKVDKKTSS